MRVASSLDMKTILKVVVLICTFNIIASVASAPFTPPRELTLDEVCINYDTLTEDQLFDYQSKLDLENPGYEIQLGEFCNP